MIGICCNNYKSGQDIKERLERLERMQNHAKARVWRVCHVCEVLISEILNFPSAACPGHAEHVGLD